MEAAAALVAGAAVAAAVVSGKREHWCLTEVLEDGV
jgi:hypothetical protein